MSSPEEHHELGPSTLKYVELCPGYRSTNETNIFAEEGTLLHSAAETGNMEGLSDDQIKLVQSCLDYLVPLESVPNVEVFKELRVEVGYA